MFLIVWWIDTCTYFIPKIEPECLEYIGITAWSISSTSSTFVQLLLLLALLLLLVEEKRDAGVGEVREEHFQFGAVHRVDAEDETAQDAREETGPERIVLLEPLHLEDVMHLPQGEQSFERDESVARGDGVAERTNT